MKLPFNELEQRVIKFLKEQFLEKGTKPPTMYHPDVMHRAVMEQFRIDKVTRLGSAPSLALGGHSRSCAALVISRYARAVVATSTAQ